MLIPNLVQSGLDVLHLVDVFHRSLFAGGNNQPLLARHQRNFRDPLDGNKVLHRLGANIDERAQTIVLAEIAARAFVARRAVLNLAHGLQPDECCLLAISPQPQRFLRRSNRS